MLQPIPFGSVNPSTDNTNVLIIPHTPVHSEVDQIMDDHPSYTGPISVAEDEAIAQIHSM